MKSSKNGFSFIEVLVALVVSSMLALGIWQLLRGHVQSTKNQTQASRQLRNAQRARFMMSNDLAQAGYDPQQGGAFEAIQTNGDSSFVLRGDFNSTGAIETTVTPPDINELVTYTYEGGAQQVTRNNTIFLQDVESFSAAYLDANSNPATADNAVRKVRIQWTQPGKGIRKDRQHFTITLRNRQN